MVGRVYTRWLKALLPTLFVLGAIIALIVLYKVNTEVGEELRIILNPHSAHYQLEYGEEAQVNFTLKTNNYLFCEALCTYTTSVNGNKINSGEFVLHDASQELIVKTTTPVSGAGKQLYELDIGCKNIPTRTCGRDSRVHRTSALVSVEYGPSALVMEERALVLPQLQDLLYEVHEADIALQEIQEQIRVLDEQSLDGLYDAAATVNSEFDLLEEDVMSMIDTWSRGGVVEVPETTILNQTKQLQTALQGYIIKQHALASNVENAVSELENVYQAYLVERELGSGRVLSSYANQVRGLARDMEQEPNFNVLTREQEYLGLVLQKESAVNNSLVLFNAILFNRVNRTVTNLDIGFELLGEYCASNQTANDTVCDLLVSEPNALWTRSPSSIERAEKVHGTYSSTIPLEVEEIEFTCSVFGSKEKCKTYTPVLFLHGHSVLERNAPEYSLQAFASYVHKLEEDELYMNGGALTTYDRYSGSAGQWLGYPIAVTGTYYLDAYLNGSSYITSAAKSESIDTYAIAVSSLVETLRIRSGSEKVKVVAFSMGGLVARRHLQLFGEEKVDELILIGTPNQGIDASVARFCPWLGANKECTEMTVGSSMLAKINDPIDEPTIPVTMIYGVGCDTFGKDGDGIVAADSAKLSFARNIEITGDCSEEYLHTKLVKVDLHEDVYEEVRELLSAE